MKAYINQIFEEGLASSIYIPLSKKIKSMNNKGLAKFFIIMWKSLYVLIVVIIAILLLICKL